MKTKTMTNARLLFTASAIALCASLIPARLHAGPPLFSAIDLGPWGSWYGGMGISNNGQVTSIYGGSDNNYHSVRLTATTQVGLGPGWAMGINDAGQVVGWDRFGNALKWTGTTPTVLGVGRAYGINNAGQVTGFAGANSTYTAVRWNGATSTYLDTPGGSNSYGYGINASGQVAGNIITGSSRQVARWTGTAATVLSPLGAGRSADAYGINASGQVVGVSGTNDGSAHAVVWTGTTPTDLGTLGGRNSYGFGINASGDVVGKSETTFGSSLTKPFLYTGGEMYDLNDLLLPGSGVTNLRLIGYGGNIINDLGQIAITGTLNGQGGRALLLTPTPEPASALLFLGGGALLALRHRRNKIGI